MVQVFLYSVLQEGGKRCASPKLWRNTCERPLWVRPCCKYDINMTSIWRLIWLWLLYPCLHGMVITLAKLNSVRTTLQILTRSFFYCAKWTSTRQVAISYVLGMQIGSCRVKQSGVMLVISVVLITIGNESVTTWFRAKKHCICCS